MQTPGQHQAPPAGAGATSTRPASAQSTSTLAQLVDAYMAEYAGRDRTRPQILAWWVAKLGARPFAELTEDDVLAGLDELRSRQARVYVGRDAAGAPIHRGKGKLSPATVNRYHVGLMAVLTWAIKRRRSPRGWENPACKIERAPERNQVVRFLTEDERARLLEACKHSAWPRLYCLVLMAITTGARRAELLGLTWGDVDLKRGLALLDATKNGERRALPLVPTVVDQLRRWELSRCDIRVFPGKGVARLYEPRSFDSSWASALRAARIKRFRFHDLRHTCASYLAQNGASLLEIADVMGHRQLAMVKRYAHLTVDSKAKLVNRVLGEIK